MIKQVFYFIALLPTAQAFIHVNKQAGTKYRDEFIDSDYWHPKNANFEIIDWGKFDAQNPSVPKVLEPIQKHNSIAVRGETFSWHNRCPFDPPPHMVWGKPEEGKINDPDHALFKGILGLNPDSSKVPRPFRNRLFWMENNDAPEELVSFNRAAWRSDTKEGRAVGLSCMNYDWTNNPNERGFAFASKTNYFINYQVSPNGKWIKLFVITGPPSNPKIEGLWLTMYVVQEDDEIKQDGKKIKAGEIIRVTYEGKKDPYDCDQSNIIFTYHPLTVAMIDEDTGEITVDSENYEKLKYGATRCHREIVDVSDEGLKDTPCSMSMVDRFDFQVKYVSNTQMYKSSPTPPSGDIIENL